MVVGMKNRLISVFDLVLGVTLGLVFAIFSDGFSFLIKRNAAAPLQVSID